MSRAPAAAVALVTAAAARDLDEDLPLLVDACRRLGLEVSVEEWDDPHVDWAAYDLAVIRSTWDYTTRVGEFLAWADRVEECTTLHNPAAVLRWNTDKRYLADLAARGVPVVPSTFLEVGTEVADLAAGLPDRVGLVVKPTVSAGSRDTARYAPGRLDAVAAHVAALHDAGRTAMVQPYREAVDSIGEAALLCFAGEFSHSIRKAALLTVDAPPSRALFAPEMISAREPEPDELATTAAVLGALAGLPAFAALAGPPLYARVDLLRTDDGGLELLELELAEPSVFLDRSPGAAARFAAAISAAASAGSRPGS